MSKQADLTFSSTAEVETFVRARTGVPGFSDRDSSNSKREFYEPITSFSTEGT